MRGKKSRLVGVKFRDSQGGFIMKRVGVFRGGFSTALIALLVFGVKVSAECGPTTVEMITDATDCLEIGQDVSLELWLLNADHLVLGGQFFIEYNPTVFQVEAVEAGDDPFTSVLFVNTSVPGRIVYSVVVFPFSNPGTSADTVMGRIRFQVIGEGGEGYFRFRLNDPPTPTQLVTLSGGLVPRQVVGGDESKDLRDFADLQLCFSEGADAAREECSCQYDFNSNDLVDYFDYRVLSQGWTGPADNVCD